MEIILSKKIRELRTKAEVIIKDHVAPQSVEVDQKAMWPKHTFKALAKAGFLGLHVPERLGGMGQGLLALAVISEQIGKVDPSSGLCFGMHNVGTAVMVAKATKDHEERYLRPIAEGKHITTLALSESATGAEFYFPQTKLTKNGDSFIVNGEKDFITNGSHADSYVISTIATEEANPEIGEFDCLILDHKTPGLEWKDEWRGFGMRGNSSRGVHLKNVKVPKANLLGEEGQHTWYIFEIVAPYFLISMAGVYLGIAQSALDITINHLKKREHKHSGKRLAEFSVLQHSVAKMWADVEKTRALIYNACALGDAGDKSALQYILSCKADAGDTATEVVNEAMTLGGGIAYGENAFLARLLRDARAAHVMSPTTYILRGLTGRSVLGLPLL
jgi:isovaleryl-CoA dehydrogenase